MSELELVEAEAASSSDLSGVLFGEQTIDALLDMVVELARASIATADWVSVSLLVSPGRKDFETRSATSTEVRELDATQYATGRGPCVQAIRSGQVVNAVLAEETERWPEFTEQSLAEGAGSVLSTPLRVRDDVIGALNVYSSRPVHADTDQLEAAALFASKASIVLANGIAFMSKDLLNRQLEEAIATRDLIGQAKGILMAQRGVDADEAFDVLRRASQHLNRKLRDVARDVVEEARKAQQ